MHSAADRPREKLARIGASGLGDNELLALVLGHGGRGQSALTLASALLARAGGVTGLPAVMLDDLRQEAGSAWPRGAGRRGHRAGTPDAVSRATAAPLPAAERMCRVAAASIRRTSRRAIRCRPARRTARGDRRAHRLDRIRRRQHGRSAGDFPRSDPGAGRRCRRVSQPPVGRSDTEHRGRRGHSPARRGGDDPRRGDGRSPGARRGRYFSFHEHSGPSWKT